jgi:hypothetical protein
MSEMRVDNAIRQTIGSMRLVAMIEKVLAGTAGHMSPLCGLMQPFPGASCKMLPKSARLIELLSNAGRENNAQTPTRHLRYYGAFFLWIRDVCELGAEFWRDATDDDDTYFFESPATSGGPASQRLTASPRLEAFARPSCDRTLSGLSNCPCAVTFLKVSKAYEKHVKVPKIVCMGVRIRAGDLRVKTVCIELR